MSNPRPPGTEAHIFVEAVQQLTPMIVAFDTTRYEQFWPEAAAHLGIGINHVKARSLPAPLKTYANSPKAHVLRCQFSSKCWPNFSFRATIRQTGLAADDKSLTTWAYTTALSSTTLMLSNSI
jgi:hypothetical protein